MKNLIITIIVIVLLVLVWSNYDSLTPLFNRYNKSVPIADSQKMWSVHIINDGKVLTSINCYGVVWKEKKNMWEINLGNRKAYINSDFLMEEYQEQAKKQNIPESWKK